MMDAEGIVIASTSIQTEWEGKSIAESALIGNVCAGITITGRGALNPMPYRKEVYDKVRNLR